MQATQPTTHPRMRAERMLRWLTAALGATAILLGVLTMHTTGSDHPPQTAPLAASSTEALSASAGSAVAATQSTQVNIGGVLHCDQTCVESVLECALAMATCAALLLLVAFAMLVHRPATRRSGRTLAFLADIWARRTRPMPRPSLDQLSISRT